jgi:hypothetical protein
MGKWGHKLAPTQCSIQEMHQRENKSSNLIL